MENSTQYSVLTNLNQRIWKRIDTSAQTVKNPPACGRPRFDPWVRKMPQRSHSSILAWRIPWTEEPGMLQSMGLQSGIGPDWATNTLTLLLWLGSHSVFFCCLCWVFGAAWAFSSCGKWGILSSGGAQASHCSVSLLRSTGSSMQAQ